MLMLSIVYIYQMNYKATEEIGNNISIEYRNITESYEVGDNYILINNTDGEEKTPIKLRGKIFTGEYPITKNSDDYWYVSAVFDSNTTEELAEEIIYKYDISKPLYIRRAAFSYPEYYMIVSMRDFESIKNQLEEDNYSNIQLAKKIKITGENITAAVWGVNEDILPRLKSSGVQLKETMVIDLVYGPETPQIESKNIMEQLDRNEKVIDTTVDFFYGMEPKIK